MNRHLYRLAGLIGLWLLGFALPAHAGERVEIGSVAPDLSLPSLEGEQLTLSERRGEGPTVLVFFRGAW